MMDAPTTGMFWLAIGLFAKILLTTAATFDGGAGSEPPYSCRLLYDEQKKCAFGSCDTRVLERLRNECLRDGGRP
jgi:hypothetical protein